MAGSVNKVILIGNLGQDPEVKSFQNGGRICNLRIATSESWKDKNTGEKKERTEWHNVDLWGKQAENAAEYLGKGSHVNIVGRLRNNNYQDNDGVEVYGLAFTVDEIDYLDSKAEGEARRARDGAGEPPAPGAANSSRKARNERQPAHA